MRLVLLGAPGAGKGTQGVVLADHFGVPHISSGDLLRSHVIAETELGRRLGFESIGVAAHPAGHPKSPDLRSDRGHLAFKMKLADFVDDPKQRRPDITLAHKILGWGPKVGLEAGLKSTLASFRKKRT